MAVKYEMDKFQFTPLREGRRTSADRRNEHGNFNSRPSARGDVPAVQRRGRMENFNSRPSARGDSLVLRRVSNRRYFNSRPSARGDVRDGAVSGGGNYFNSRPSARGDAESAATADAAKRFQFTPLREGRPQAPTPQLGGITIFQFTPLREGRRSGKSAHLPCCGNFNSRPSARGDFPGVRESGRRENFNSRPSARGDFCGFPTTFALQISIHAPPRGATDEKRAGKYAVEDFNSRPSARGDPPSLGARGHGSNFNSRPSARGDSRFLKLSTLFSISIHAPPRGATYFDTVPHKATKFQFTPLREGRRTKRRSCLRILLFQFTPLREGRPDGSVILRRTPKVFQFTPLREGRLHAQPCMEGLFLFQFTPLREGRRRTWYADYTYGEFQFTPLREGRRVHENEVLVAETISIHAPPRGATFGKRGKTNLYNNFNSRPSARGDVPPRGRRSHKT